MKDLVFGVFCGFFVCLGFFFFSGGSLVLFAVAVLVYFYSAGCQLSIMYAGTA